MAYDDMFRMSAHAVILDEESRVLLLKANYGAQHWGLPGGALEPGETIHEAVLRECKEELGLDVKIECLTGVYYHSAYNSQVFLFRAHIDLSAVIKLSDEHTAFAYHALDTLSDVQRIRVQDALDYDGAVVSRRF